MNLPEEVTELSPEVARSASAIAKVLHGAILRSGEKFFLLEPDALQMDNPKVMVKGQLGGANWLLLSSGFPWQDEAVTPYTGGKALHELDGRMVQLVLRIMAEETIGKVADLSIGEVGFAPSSDSWHPSEWDMCIPLEVRGANSATKLILCADAQLSIAQFVEQFATAAKPGLPVSLTVAMKILVGSVMLDAADFTNLGVGDVIIIGHGDGMARTAAAAE